jgi:predicted nucleotidyltransferase component of viral defense system
MNEAALKDRIKVIAKERGVPFNEVWKQLLLERFLARLSNSLLVGNFVFKGGLLLSQKIRIGRETTDVDFLMTKLKSEMSEIESAFRQICLVDLRDGFFFKWDGVQELTQAHMEYPGFRVLLSATFERMRDKIQVDLGVGDAIQPSDEAFRQFEYRGKPLFDGEIRLLTYPVESIFAEKLETILSKGGANSRMKDYHDVVLMIREPELLKTEALKRALATTFSQRGTRFIIPFAFDEPGIQLLQRLWANHLKGLGRTQDQLKLPERIDHVIDELNGWLKNSGIAAANVE